VRTATTIEASGGSWPETVEFVREAERLGLDICWVAEAWGSEAPSALGYLAARTSRLLLGSGIIQLGTRTPVAIAQAAITLSNISGGRFLLGLGASGPQVIEGLHGVPFGRPVTRMRETVEIVRLAALGMKVSFAGREFAIPLPGSGARPMRLSMRAEYPIPVYLATLSPAMLRLTGEIADGWLGTSFVPEGAAAYFRYLDEGLAAAGRTRGDLDVCQGAEVAFCDTAESLGAMVASRKPGLAFSLGGMGTASSNFYNDAYSRQGWADVAAEVRERWQAGDRDGAAQLVTDEMVLATTLIGTEDMVRERLRVWRDAGVDTVRLYPAGETLADRLDTLGRALDLVRALSLGQAVVEVAEVVGQDLGFGVGGVVAAGLLVQVPLGDVLVVAFGEPADAGEVAVEARQSQRDRGGLGGKVQGDVVQDEVSSRLRSPIASSVMSCAFQPSRPAGESASACAIVCGCWECSWLNEILLSMNHWSLASAARSASSIPLNSAGSPDGNEKTWVTCTPPWAWAARRASRRGGGSGGCRQLGMMTRSAARTASRSYGTGQASPPPVSAPPVSAALSSPETIRTSMSGSTP
jgi:F420-dependent oxidoreductase-like protein